MGEQKSFVVIVYSDNPENHVNPVKISSSQRGATK